MRTFLIIVVDFFFAGLLLWAKYSQLRSSTKDLSDGGIQRLFDDEPK
jgi:hypothetical protein